MSTFCGVGFLKPGPGTYVSCVAALLWYLGAHAFHPAAQSLVVATLVAALLTTFVGIPAATTVAYESGSEDPGYVVIDEVAGQFFALLGLSATWKQALLALVIFRALDIFKPPPIRQLERLPAGIGIMLDDVAAGLFACILAHLLLFVCLQF